MNLSSRLIKTVNNKLVIILYIDCADIRYTVNIEFYKTTLGAEVVDIGMTILTLFGAKFSIEDDEEEVGINNGLIMNVFLANEEEVTAVFNKLAEKGQITVPLKPDHWTTLWGFVDDPFGIRWCIAVEHDYSKNTSSEDSE